MTNSLAGIDQLLPKPLQCLALGLLSRLFSYLMEESISRLILKVEKQLSEEFSKVQPSSIER